MKNTPFKAQHEALGAKMVDFAGWYMPLQYDGLKIEHERVRTGVGVFDVSHMGEFIIRGADAFSLVQWVTANDVSKLYDGKVQYSCLTRENGGIVDDLLVYRIDSKTYMLVVNASNIQKDWDWIQSQNRWADVECINISDRTALLAVQGPKAMDALQSLTDMNLHSMEFYTLQKGVFAGVENVLISTTGYTGAGGVEIYFDEEHAQTIWDAVFRAGEPLNIGPAGLGARDTLRTEMGFCLYGNDITDETTPLEAGLGWITVLDSDFCGADALRSQKNGGLTRRLVGFEMIERGIPRKDYPIVTKEGEVIGVVTSGTMSPSLDKAIGMGYVNWGYHQNDTTLYIQIRNKQIQAQVVRPPFYKG